MSLILIATDSTILASEIEAAVLTSQSASTSQSELHQVHVISSGFDVRSTAQKLQPDLIILDMQIDGMGGIACAMDIRLDESEGILPRIPIILTLDREVDEFIAKRADINAWVIKPINPITLQETINKFI